MNEFKIQDTTPKNYEAFVENGLKREPIWSELNNQIYLGDAGFIEKVQKHMDEQENDIQIPKVQKRAKPKSLSYYEGKTKNRNGALVEAYASGGYSYQELGDYFNLHFTSVGNIIRKDRESKS
jgi:REP-associated tyrosine transposase